MKKKVLLSLVALMGVSAAWAQDIASGYYRLKNVGNNKYMAAPNSLAYENTSSESYKATTMDLSADNDGKNRTVWYIENLGTPSGSGDIVYRLWCYQSGFGLSTNPRADVYGSYANDYCPRMYSIKQIGETNSYTIAGHDREKTAVTNGFNYLGLSTGGGAIGNYNPLSVNGNNELQRNGDAANANSQWELESVNPNELAINVTIGATGYATYSCYSSSIIPSGLKAYKATSVDTQVHMELLNDVIPANMGVVLKGTPNTTYEMVPTNHIGSGHKLYKSDGTVDLQITPSELEPALGTCNPTNAYILVNNNGTVMFGKLQGGEAVPSGKAYLDGSNLPSSVNAISFTFDDIATAITEAETKAEKNGKYFDGKQIVIVKNGLKYNTKGQAIR